MKFIIFYKRIFLALYAANFTLILYNGFTKWGFSDGAIHLPMLFSTFIIFSINLYTHEILRKGTVRPVLITIETSLSYCRLIMNALAFTLVGVIFTIYSPVSFVIWRPLISLTLENVLPKYSFPIICILLFLFELCYLSEINILKKKTSKKLDVVKQQ